MSCITIPGSVKARYTPGMRMGARCKACMDGWNAMYGDICWVQAMYEDACQVHGMYEWLKCQAWGCMSGARHVWVAGMPGMRTHARYKPCMDGWNARYEDMHQENYI